MKIKVNNEIMKTNGTLGEIAERYFQNERISEIEILEADENIYENEYFRRIPTKIYRASKEEVEKFKMWYNVRVCFKVEYKPKYSVKYKNYSDSAGLCVI